jgi:hypothetical protein
VEAIQPTSLTFLENITFDLIEEKPEKKKKKKKKED